MHICSGERTRLAPEQISEATEVPATVVEAIKLAQDKRPIPECLPRNEYDEDANPWDADVYYDDYED